MEIGWVGGCGWAWRTERAVSWQVEDSLDTLELRTLAFLCTPPSPKKGWCVLAHGYIHSQHPLQQPGSAACLDKRPDVLLVQHNGVSIFVFVCDAVGYFAVFQKAI